MDVSVAAHVRPHICPGARTIDPPISSKLIPPAASAKAVELK
jgi:hypothetical protein